jgi:thymidine phosphorylase
MAGHSLEILESFDCLEGRGPADLRELVCLQGGEMLRLGGLVRTLDEGRERIARSLDDGSARAVFARVIEEQGGDPRCLDDRTLLKRASKVEVVRARRDGVLMWRDLRALGAAICELGGGRKKLGDVIDLGVGLEFEVTDGTAVKTGDALLRVHHEGHGLAQAHALIERAYELVEAHRPEPLVLASWSV